MAILPSKWGISSLYLSFSLPPLEQALSASAVEELLASLTKLEAMASVAWMPLCCLILELVASVVPSVFPLLAYSPSSSYLGQ